MRHHAKTLVLIAAFLAGPALADGQHSVKFTFKTNVKQALAVYVYNGKDKVFSHKLYTIRGGGKRTMKCHGQGKGRCVVDISNFNRLGHTELIVEQASMKDGTECTFSKVEGMPDDKYKYMQSGYKLTCTK